MQLLVYRLSYPFLWVISKLPWPIFYAFSTCVYIFIYHIIRYRRKAVTENLVLVFPEKTEREIAKIRKKFYKHMCDMFLEMIKSLSITKEEMIERFKIIDTHTIKALEAKNKSIIVLMGHYASYEWAIAAQFSLDFPIVAVYKRIRNKYFDKLVHRIRRRFDAKLISSHKAMKQITKDHFKGKLCSYGLISDQSPRLKNATYWTDFMGIKVPVFMGGEALAKKLSLPVAYLHVEKVKRGHYQAKFVTITEDASSCEDYFVVKTYLKMLEKQIQQKPEHYLWTHKRWKHRNAQIPEGAVVD